MNSKFLNLFTLFAVTIGVSSCAASEIKAENYLEKTTKSHPYPEMEIAATEGNVRAQFNMGVLYDQGEEVEEDDVRAVYWYSKAADQNFAAAQMSLGEMYQKGLGVEQNLETAMKLYQSAAAQKDVKALLTLGLIYQSKKTGPYDQKESANWFLLAAQQGNPLAMTRLGAKYADGTGVKKDFRKAYMWSHLGARYGNEEATKNIKTIEQILQNTDIIVAKDMAETCLSSAFESCE